MAPVGEKNRLMSLMTYHKIYTYRYTANFYGANISMKSLQKHTFGNDKSVKNVKQSTDTDVL